MWELHKLGLQAKEVTDCFRRTESRFSHFKNSDATENIPFELIPDF